MLEIESLFDASYYFDVYPEVKAATRNGFSHFLDLGRTQGNDPSPFFDTDFYLKTNDDVAAEVTAKKTTAIDHFIRHGQFEGRDPIAEFNTKTYLAQNTDVRDAIATTIDSSDPLTAYGHFVKFGQYEGRDSSATFNTGFYLINNPDVAAAIVEQPSKVSAIGHYLEYGTREGRLGAPPVSPIDPAPPVDPIPSTPQPRSAFSPNVDGFSFENYKSSEAYLNLTPVEMRRMFGDVVLSSAVKSDGSFKLTPTAEKWMEWANSTMRDGHCEGLAALSLQMYEGRIDPKTFGADRVADLQLEGNPKLQRELAYWYATALLDSNESIKTSPNDAVAALRTSFETTGSAGGTLRIVNPDGSGGHSVTPIGLTDLPDGRVSIAVYDVNYPKETREVLIDPTTNTWFYSPDATLTEDDYRGDAETDTLGFAPLAQRSGRQVWPFGLEPASTTPIESTPVARSADASNPLTTPIPPEFDINNLAAGTGFKPPATNQTPAQTNTKVDNQLDIGKGNTLITGDLKIVPKVDSSYGSYQGALGTKGNEPAVLMAKGLLAPKAPITDVHFSANLRSWETPAVVSYNFDSSEQSVFTTFGLQASPNATEEQFVRYIGSGYVFEIDNLQLDEDQIDTVLIDTESSVILYNTATGVVPDLFVGFETAAADYNLYLNDFELEADDAVILDIDAAARLVRMQVQTTAETGDTIFSFAMERIDDVSIDVFDSADDGIVLADGEVLLIDYSSWNGNDSPLRLGYDTNDNGLLDTDEVFEIVDEGDTFDDGADFVFDPALFENDPFFNGGEAI